MIDLSTLPPEAAIIVAVLIFVAWLLRRYVPPQGKR